MLKRTIIINGVKTTLVAEAEEKLSDVLRKQLGLTGTKVGCGSGECGTCTVIHNGKLIRACITKMKKVEDNDEIITIEGVGTKDKLHPLQIAWMVHGGAQCGFCTPGFIVSVFDWLHALLLSLLFSFLQQVVDLNSYFLLILQFH